MEPILDSADHTLEQALLRAGRDVSMSPELRAKTMATLGLGGAAVGLGGAAAGLGGAAVGLGGAAIANASTKVGSWAWLTSQSGIKVTLGVFGTLGLAGAVFYGLQQGSTVPTSSLSKSPGSQAVTGSNGSDLSVKDTASESQPSEPRPSAPQSAAAEPQPPERSAVETPGQDDKPVSQPSNEGSPKRQARERSPTKLTGVEPTSMLGAELSHLAQVETALRKNQPTQALALLAEYRSRFSRPNLGLEAEVLTIQALHNSGSLAAARSRAKQFVDKHPSSPLGAHVKQYLRE